MSKLIANSVSSHIRTHHRNPEQELAKGPTKNLDMDKKAEIKK